MRRKTIFYSGFLLTIFLLGGLISNAQSVENWNISHSWNVNKDYRGIAYNPDNNHLYVAGTIGSHTNANDATNNYIQILDAATGDSVSTLTLDTITLAANGYGIRDVEVSADGGIFATITTTNQYNPQKIYYWASEDEKAIKLWDDTSGDDIDFGPGFSVYGDFSSEALIIIPFFDVPKAYYFEVVDGELGAVNTIEITGATGDAGAHIQALGTKITDGFWYSNLSQAPTLVDGTGAITGTIDGTIFSGATGDVKQFMVADNKYLSVSVEGDVVVLDITNASTDLSNVTSANIIETISGTAPMAPGWPSEYGDGQEQVAVGYGFPDTYVIYSFSGSNYLKSVAPEAAPFAADLMLTGYAMVDSLAQVSYTYNDVNNDAEGTSLFKWFVSDDDQGTNKTEFSTEPEITVPYEYMDKYLSFSVLAVAETGTISDENNWVESSYYGSVTASAHKPEATELAITGDPNVYGTLTGSYTFNDVDGDDEGESILKWWSADDAIGTNAVEMAVDTNKYMPVPEDEGKYIIFSVVPVSTSPNFSTGDSVAIATTTAVVFPEYDPTAENLNITGIEEVTRTLTGSYEYKDLNPADSEDASYQTWYRADAVDGTKTVTSIESNSYELTKADSGKFVFFGVTPISAEDMLASGTGLYQFDDETDLWKNTAAGKGLNTVMAEGVFKYTADGDIASTEGTDYSFVDGMNGKAVSLKANNWLKVWHGIPANGEGTWVNDFTVVMDVQVSDSNGIYSLLEVNPEGTGNGYTSELEIDSLRLGSVGAPSSGANAFGFSTDSIDINKFYRVTYVAKLAEYIKVYVDGVHVNTIEGDFTDSRPAPYTADRHPDDAAIRLGGNNEVERDGDKVIDMMAVFGRSLTEAEVAHLGVAGDLSAGNVGVEAFANTGEIQPAPEETAPEALEVSIIGTPEVGVALYGEYTYYDYTDDLEGESVYKWYTADDAAGTNRTEIADATDQTLVVSEDLIGKHIVFEVTPVALTGGLLEGTPNADTSLTATVESTNDGDFERVWLRSAKADATPNYIGAGSTERGFAVGANHIYIASRKDGTDLLVVDKNDGSLIAKMNTEGMDVGLFKISDVEVSEDGQILACPLQIDASAEAFVIYKWADELAAPTKFIEFTAPEAIRLGDKFTVVGDVSGSAVIYAAQAAGNKVVRWTVTNGIPDAGTVITLEDITSIGSTPAAYPFSNSPDANFIVDGRGFQAQIFDKDGMFVSALEGVGKDDNQSNSPNIFTHKDRTMVAFHQKNESGLWNVIVKDITSANHITVGTSEVLSTANQELGGVHVESDEDNFHLYMLSANNGLAYFTGMLELPEFVYAESNTDGTQILASFSKNMADSVGLATGWKVMVEGSETAIDTIYGTDTDADVLTIEIATALTEGQEVTLEYDGTGNTLAFDGMPLKPFGPVVIENLVGADAPVATDVTISGTVQTGQEVTGSYTFTDEDGDLEAESIYQWYYANDDQGTDMLKIIGGKDLTYTISDDMKGKYIAFEVIPVAATGGIDFLVGEPAISDFMLVEGVGVDETFANAVNMYPNPVNNTLTINNCNDVQVVKVIDYTGRTIMSVENTGNNELNVNMSELNAGVYIIQLTGENNATKVQRVVKN